MADKQPYSIEEFQRLIRDPLPEMARYFEAEKRYLLDYANARGSAIDVGCGPGRMLDDLGVHIRNMTGVDCDSRMIEAAREATKYSMCKIELRHADFLDLRPFPWRRADLVFASYNLPGNDGMNDDLRLKLLRRMVRFAKPGGHAVVSFWKPTPSEWLERYYGRAGIVVREYLPGNVVRTCAGTFKRFTTKEVEDLAFRTGLPFRRVELTPMWDLLHFVRPKL